MSKKIINPPSLAPARGFNHGILTSGGQVLFLAGQTGSDTAGQIGAPNDLVAQYEQILRNFKAVVEAAGGKMQDIVKINMFVRSRDDYLAHLKELGLVHKAFFGNYYPTAALFEITGLVQEDALLEIEGIAVIGADDK